MRSFMPLFLVFVVLASGCGGINSRIKDHRREFETYPPEAQAQIQNGRIDKGFDEGMVFLARGEPSEKTKITRNGKEIVVWKYARPAPPTPPGGGSSNLAAPYGYPGFGPGAPQPMPMFYERSYFNVEFIGGKVIGWDSGFQADIP